MSIRIVIVDDHGIIRSSLKSLLANEPEMEFVGEAATAQAAIEVIRETQPDIVTLDLGLPDQCGLEVIPLIQEASPQTRILVFTGKDDPVIVREALLAGVDAYVVKAASSREVGTAIRNLEQGRSMILLTESPEASVSLLGLRVDHDHDHDHETSTALAELSEREIEVLTLIASGHTNQAIADQLYLSVKTVETYRSRLGRKLKLKTRADMVRFALESGVELAAKP